APRADSRGGVVRRGRPRARAPAPLVGPLPGAADGDRRVGAGPDDHARRPLRVPVGAGRPPGGRRAGLAIAVADALAGHGRARARRPRRRAARRAGLAVRRDRGRGHLDRLRHRGRGPGRPLRRLGGRRHDAIHGAGPVAAQVLPRHHHRLDVRRQPAQHRPAAGADVLALDGAAAAGPAAVPARAGVRRRRSRHRRLGAEAVDPAPAPERAAGDRGQRLAPSRWGDPGRGGPQLPRPGRQELRQLGVHVEQRAAVHPTRVVDVGLSRLGPAPDGRRRQPRRRRRQRGHQPSARGVRKAL
ncbi:MAG: ABC transporter, permease protein 2 (cluster 5, nickel/peptides/opines), partial [uncultured Thermomicrobiales bacterium]